MSTTAIDFPANRSQLDPSLNPPPYTDIPLENGDTFIASGSSYTWAQDETEAYGRWKNEDPGATSDARYVKKEDEGATQVINGGGTLSINDNIELHGSDGSGTFAGTVAATDAVTVSSSTAANTFSNVNANGLICQNPIADSNQVFFRGRTSSGDNKVTINTDGSATFSGNLDAAAGIFNNGKAKVFVSSGDAGLYVYDVADTSTPTAIINKDGSCEFGGGVTQIFSSYGISLDSPSGASSNSVVAINNDGTRVIDLKADGSSTFSGILEVKGTGRTQLSPAGYVFIGSVAADYQTPALDVYNSLNVPVAQIFADGSANFSSLVQTGGVQANSPSAGTSSLQAWGSYAAGVNTSSIKTDGSATFTSVNGQAFSIQLEADDDTKYTTTTETYTEPQTYTGPLGNEITMDVEKTREVRTYTGAVMDVKEAIQSLVTRCDNRDAQIAALTTRIAQLELPGTPEPEPTPEPTPVVPHNLIPDTWSQEQRMAAMSELLQEYQANRD